MQEADSNAFIKLIIRATCVESLANWEKTLAANIKKGAPGGWPTSNLYALNINSGQSQNEAVGSIVKQ